MISEPRAARIALNLPVYATVVPYSAKPGHFLGWDISLGGEIPIFGFDSRSIRTNVLKKGEQGFAVLTPVSFHVLEDLRSKVGPSAPILNTDYRFGTMLKYGIGLSEDWRFAARVVPWAHESTHLGDEFTLSARTMPGFKRINVSYEYWEAAGAVTGDHCKGLQWLILFNTPDNSECRTTFRAGFLQPLPHSKGYYSEGVLEPPG